MRTLYFLLIGLIVTLTGCTRPTKELTEIAVQCIATDISPAEKRFLGERVTLSGNTAQTPSLVLGRFDYVGCKGAELVFEDNDHLEAFNQALANELGTDANFREGVYGASFRRLGFNRDKARIAGTLGKELETHAELQRVAHACNWEPLPKLKILADLDLPFATAVLGINGIGLTPEEAQHYATSLYTSASTTVIASAAVTGLAGNCEDSGSLQRWLGYTQDMALFVEGTHPWARGCAATMDQGDWRLRCGSAPSKR